MNDSQYSCLGECDCHEPTHGEPELIVVTGGPGAGKTAFLETVRRTLCEHVAVLPEAAGIIFSGGFWRRDTLPAKKSAQRAIYYVQRELQRIVTEEREVALGLCDRGTIDGLAYWPADEESYWRELNTDRQAEFSRYELVIHLRTPTLSQGYNHQNPIRIESAATAAEIDERLLHVWDGHPRRIVIESTDDFTHKVSRALEVVRGELPACCVGGGAVGEE